jgi:hypothetical protein
VWGIVQPYSSTNTYSWVTLGLPPGTYRFSVWARNAGSGSAYDTFNAFDYVLTTSACTGMTASASPATSAGIGTPVTVTGTASGCPNPRYEFWLRTPGGAWSLARGYATSNTFVLSTAGRGAGTYRFSVWARDASSSGSNGTAPYTYDAFQAFDYTLTITPCTGMSASAVPASTAPRGTTIAVTGSASGCSNPLYEFWLKNPSGTWTLVQGWTATATYNWQTTTATPPGSYRFSVWARDGSSSGTAGTAPYTYDAFSAFDYTLT